MTFGRTTRRSRGRATAMTVLVVLAGCGYPAFGFVPDDAQGDAAIDAPDDTQRADVLGDAPIDAADAHDGAPEVIVDARDADGFDAAPCPVIGSGDACATIPRFGADSQVVDGVGDEFCGIPATKLVANAGPHMEPSTPPGGIDTVMWTRVAWSTTAIHVHIRVDQAMVYAPLSTEELWRGDGVELFISGSSTLTGDFTTAKQPGTLQIIAVPPQTGTPPRAGVYYGSDGLQTFLDPAHFAARLTPTGYEIELKIDWTDLKATPTSGNVIGFDAAVDVRQTASSTLKLQSFIGYRAVTVTSPCSPRSPHPSCDDRTWCIPALE